MNYTPAKEVVEQVRRNNLEKIKDDIKRLKAGTYEPAKLKYPPPGKCQVWLEWEKEQKESRKMDRKEEDGA